jgi:hypothetical protein
VVEAADRGENDVIEVALAAAVSLRVERSSSVDPCER